MRWMQMARCGAWVGVAAVAVMVALVLPRSAAAEAATGQVPIRYELAEPGRVSLAVYDAEGRVLRTLLRGVEQSAGAHTVMWDGLDRDGRPAAPGAYEWRLLRTPGFTARLMMTLATSEPMQAYEIGGRHAGRSWVGNHGGPFAVLVESGGDEFYLGAPIGEFVPILLRQRLDGSRQQWRHYQYEVNMGPIALGRGSNPYFTTNHLRLFAHREKFGGGEGSGVVRIAPPANASPREVRPFPDTHTGEVTVSFRMGTDRRFTQRSADVEASRFSGVELLGALPDEQAEAQTKRRAPWAPLLRIRYDGERVVLDHGDGTAPLQTYRTQRAHTCTVTPNMDARTFRVAVNGEPVGESFALLTPASPGLVGLEARGGPIAADESGDFYIRLDDLRATAGDRVLWDVTFDDAEPEDAWDARFHLPAASHTAGYHVRGMTRLTDDASRQPNRNRRAGIARGAWRRSLYVLQRNAKVVVVDADTGAKRAMWDLLPEGVERDPKRNYGSGEWVYLHDADLVARGDTLVISTQPQDLLRWIDPADGSVRHRVELPAPGGMALDPQARLYVISEGAVLRVSPDGQRETIIDATHLTEPHRLAYDAHHDHLLVAERQPSEQVKRFTLDGELVATYGRAGSRETGAYVPTDFHGVTDIAADGRGGFLITEPHGAPRRVAHFDADGTLIREWYGGVPFFTPTTLDPEDPTLVWYPTGGGWSVLAKLDYDRGTWRVLETHHTAHAADGLLAPKVGWEQYTMVRVRYHDGRRYLVAQASPPVVMIHDPEAHTLTPVVVGGNTRGEAKQLARAKELAGQPDSKAEGFLWTDRNGDRAVQAEEIELFEHGLEGGPTWKGVSLGRGFDVLTSGRRFTDDPRHGVVQLRRLRHTGWTEHGVPTYASSLELVGEADLEAGVFNTMGFFEDRNGAHYMLASANADRHGNGWPLNYTGADRLIKWQPGGQHAWSVGRHAVRDPHHVDNPSPPGRFNHPVGFLGEVRDTIIVGDRVVRPATAWTRDGLYAGYFLEGRADDGLGDHLYHWWRTSGGVECIINYDCEAIGTVATLDDGRVFWFATGWQTVPVYEITGWDGWTRRQGTVTLDTTPPHARAEGTGLQGDYYDSLDLSGDPTLSRTDGLLWFTPKNWYGYPASVGGQVWADRGPAPDTINPAKFSARWTGTVEAPLTEPFIFSAYAHPDGAVRVWLDDRKLLDTWDTAEDRRRPVRVESDPVELQAGRRYALRVEYRSTGPNPTFSLNWESPTRDRQRIPRRYLYVP